MTDGLSKSYALAIYDIAKENRRLDKYVKDIKEISNLINTNSELHNFIENHEISVKRKQEVIRQQLIDKVDKDLLSFLLILIEKDMFSSLNEISKELNSIYSNTNNEIPALVKTAVELTEEQKEKLISKLEAKYNKKIILNIVKLIFALIIGGVMGAKLLTSGSEILIIAFFVLCVIGGIILSCINIK